MSQTAKGMRGKKGGQKRRGEREREGAAPRLNPYVKFTRGQGRVVRAQGNNCEVEGKTRRRAPPTES